MKFLAALVVLVAAAAAVPELSVRAQFALLKQQAGRAYASPEVEATHFSAFLRNKKAVEEASSRNPRATFALTADNFDRLPRKAAVIPSAASVGKARVDAALAHATYPSSLDWRTKGAVGPVHNGGQCGGANPAFTALDNIEGTFFVKSKADKLVAGSAEQLIDCASRFGCNGGIFADYYRWVLQKNHGEIATNASYPFVGGGKPCKHGEFPPAAKITGFKAVPRRNETALTQFVATMGPITAAVYAAGQLEFYTGGVLTDCGSGQVDSGALVVGYDDAANPPYWILKNTWGTAWGEQGYFRIEKGKNVCGVADAAYTAIPADKL